MGSAAVPSRFYVSLDPGADPAAVAARLEAAQVAHGVDTATFRSLVDDRIGTEIGFFRLMQSYLSIGLVVGIAGMAVVMVRAARERRRQVGMLRTIGFSADTVRRAFLVEASFIALQGIATGVGLGLLVSYQMLSRSAALGGDPLPYSVPWATVGALAVIPFAASLAVALIPAVAGGSAEPRRGPTPARLTTGRSGLPSRVRMVRTRGLPVTKSLQELSDRLEIQDLLVDYADAIDRKDFDALDDVFTPDAVIDYTAVGGIRGSLPEIKEFLVKGMAWFSSFQHLTATPKVVVDGDEATGRAICHNPMVIDLPGPARTRCSSASGTSTPTSAPRTVGASRRAPRSAPTCTTLHRGSPPANDDRRARGLVGRRADRRQEARPARVGPMPTATASRAVHEPICDGGIASLWIDSASARNATPAGVSPRATGAPVSPPLTTAGSIGIWASRGTPGLVARAPGRRPRRRARSAPRGRR